MIQSNFNSASPVVTDVTTSAARRAGNGPSRHSDAADSRLAWQAGQWAIYRKSKRSTHPGPRASSIQPNQKGDTYSYVVDKFWVVNRADQDRVELRTAGGKLHEVAANDPNLRKPTWLERWLWRERFRRVERRTVEGAE